ncbi:MAG: caspase family protein [Chloroflexota bacterium]|nr:caspase family protein [Chloroflexota bacterium]
MPAMENAHALVIGIANYQQINKLPPTVLKDAQDIRDLLVAPQHCGYPPDNVQLLLDKQATAGRIRAALKTIAESTNPESTAFLYISSHGGRVESGAYAGEYLLPVDVVPNRVNKTAISGNEFTEALRGIPARKVVVVFDCCHSGGIGQPKETTAPAIKAGFSDSYYDALKEGRGRVILASSRSSEYSWVLPGAPNSLFTQHLLAGLRGGIPSDDGLIHIFDLFEYLQPRVTGDQSNQHPIFKAELEENFPVALYLGGQKGIVPKDEEGFRYDAYVSYVHREPDAGWVWRTLAKRLKDADLRVAVSGAVEDPGVALVVGIERAIERSRRTVVVLSKAYLADNWAHFQNTIAQTLGVEERQARVLPVIIDKDLVGDDGRPNQRVRSGLRMLNTLNLTDPYLGEYNFDRLVEELQKPLKAA